MPNPVVSVVVPTYNSCNLLAEALASVRAQTLPSAHVEAIVVDDGSTDGTAAYLEELSRDWAALTVITQANTGGPATGRNKGIDAARGEFVFFLDADDWLATNALERLTAAAVANGADIVLGRCTTRC